MLFEYCFVEVSFDFQNFEFPFWILLAPIFIFLLSSIIFLFHKIQNQNEICSDVLQFCKKMKDKHVCMASFEVDDGGSMPTFSF
jgi:hypothetical protein